MIKYDLKGYFKPNTLDETLKLLHDYKGAAKIIAGGTLIHELSERNVLEGIEYYVDIENVGLNYIKTKEDGLCVGAAVSFNEIANNPIFYQPSYYALYLAAKGVSSYQVRNVATIGGSICSSISFLDVPTALVALNAKAKIVSLNKERIENMENLFLNMFTPNLAEDEILTEIILPLQDEKTSSYHMKISEKTFQYALVNVSVKIKIEDYNLINDVRVVFGNVQPIPFVESNVGKLMKGKFISDELINKVMKDIPSIEPMDSINASSWYKRKISKVLFRDALKEALKLLGDKNV